MKTLFLFLAVLLAGCALTPGDTHAARRHRVELAVLQSAADFAGKVAFSTLQNAAANGGDFSKANLTHSGTAALWANAESIVSARDVQRIFDAYSGDELKTVGAASAAAFRKADPQTEEDRQRAVNAIAASLSAAAFDSTGLP